MNNMKWSGLLFGMLAFSAGAVTIPPEPQLNSVPAPTSQQMNTVMPTSAPADKPSADEQATQALAQAYVFPVGAVQSIAAATLQAKRLQKLGLPAFIQAQPNGTAQILIGPEVDQDHLQSERQQLLTAKTPDVGVITPYVINH